jgi:hypothetical protein
MTPGSTQHPARAGPAWRQSLTTQPRGILAAGFGHVDTVLPRRIYALIVSEHGTRRAHLAGDRRAPRRLMDDTGSAHFPDGPRPARRLD